MQIIGWYKRRSSSAQIKRFKYGTRPCGCFCLRFQSNSLQHIFHPAQVHAEMKVAVIAGPATKRNVDIEAGHEVFKIATTD